MYAQNPPTVWPTRFQVVRTCFGRVAHPLGRFSFPIPELWVPRPCVVCKGGYDAACTIWFVMPSGLHRTYGAHHLHFITCSCYRRLPFLGSARTRDQFLSILEQTRERYRFVVVGYVVMPEHIHLLLTEPEVGTVSTVMQVLKQCTARAGCPILCAFCKGWEPQLSMPRAFDLPH